MKSIAFLLALTVAFSTSSVFGQDIPGRDEFGETLARFNAPRAAIGGLAWDGQYIWGTNRTAPCRLWCLNPADGEILEDYQIDQQGAAQNNADDAIGLGFDHTTGLLWVNQWNGAGARSVANLYDFEGNNVSRVQLPRPGHCDFAFDDGWVYISSEYDHNTYRNDYRIVRMNRDGEDVTVGPNLCAIANHGRMVSMTFVPQHDEGAFWLMSVSWISQFSVDWEEGEADLIREFRSNNNDYPHQGLTHDGFNLWGGGNWNAAVVCVYDDGIGEVYGELGIDEGLIDFGPIITGEESEMALVLENLAEEEDEVHVLRYAITDLGGAPDWLQIDPIEGSIDAGQSAQITLTAATEGLELGEHERQILVEANDPSHRETIITLHIFVVEGWGSLTGVITDAQNGSPIQGAIIADEYFPFVDTTDENGAYGFETIPAWNYNFRVSMDNYLQEVREIQINSGDDLNEDFALLHSVFEPRPASIEETIQFDDTLNTPLTIANTGNGPLTWSSTLDFPDELEQPPWTLRREYPVTEITADQRIQAVAFAEDHIILAGAADLHKLIYVLNIDGEVLDTFPQLSPSRYGFSSLAWDGELLWGAADQVIYGFNTSGDSITSFVGPHNPSTNVAWDSDRGLLWLSGATTNIVSCDREGNVQSTLNRRGMRQYGLGYYPEDPDGYCLYLYSNPIDTRRVVMKMNTDNNDTLLAIEFADDGGRPAGCTITNLYDPYSWIFLANSNIGAGDVLYAWHLSAKTGWITTSPESGVVEANSSEDVNLRFDANGLMPELIYETVIRFSHDGVNGSTEVPVQLSVTGEGGLTQRVLLLDVGWNLVSANLTPQGWEDFGGLMAPLVDAGRLILAKDGFGNFFWPSREFDGIDGWDGRNGYWLKVSFPCELRLSGEVMGGGTPIDLRAGWNTVAYLPRQPVAAEVGLSGLGENLVIARDGNGRFYLPSHNFSNMDRLREGIGYQVRVNEAAQLIYQQGGAASLGERFSREEVSWLEELPSRPTMFNLLVISDLPVGTRLEALTETGEIAGRGIVGERGLMGITLWGDDPLTEAIDGFAEGESPQIRLADNSKIQNPKSKIAFADGDWGVVELESVSQPMEFGLTSVYPNPFNSNLLIDYSILSASKTTLAVFDITGRQIQAIDFGMQTAGTHTFNWSPEGISAGVYLLRLESAGKVSLQKAIYTP